MRLGKRKFKGSTLTLSQSNELPEHLRAIIEISDLFTPEPLRRQGRATALLMRTCNEADKSKTVLMLMPVAGLEQWYAMHGFATIQQQPVIMARPPLTQRCAEGNNAKDRDTY